MVLVSPEHGNEAKLSASSFQPPQTLKRHCTDFLCLLILIASWVAMTGIGLAVTGGIQSEELAVGDPVRLMAPMDYQGRLCGEEEGVESKPNAYYLPYGDVVCVEACPKTDNSNVYICMDDYQDDADLSPAFGVAFMGSGYCMMELASQDILNRCIPQKGIDAIIELIPSGNGSSEAAAAMEFFSTGDDNAWLDGFMADMYEMMPLILGFGFGVSAMVGIVYLFILRVPGFLVLIVWSLLLSILALFLVGAAVCNQTSKEWSAEDPKTQTHTDQEALLLLYVSYALFAMGALYFCLLVWMRRRIATAIGIIQEAARALSHMKSLTMFPLLQVLGLLLFLIPWIIFDVFLFSSGERVVETATVNGVEVEQVHYEYSDNARYAALYLLFCFFWTSQFIIAFGQMTVALAGSMWYFTRNKKETGMATVCQAMHITFRYHLGTIAFGSLIIAIIKTIQAVVAYLQKKAQNHKNKIMEMVLCCIQCFLWCLEKGAKFLNKNAYVQTAIYGYSLCPAAKNAFFLILRNIARVAIVGVLSKFVLLLGKLLIPVLTTFVAYYVLNEFSDSINGLFGPLALIALLSYLTAYAFNEIFDMMITTILQCYVADEELFEPQDRYGEGKLKSALTTALQNERAGKVDPEVIKDIPEASKDVPQEIKETAAVAN